MFLFVPPFKNDLIVYNMTKFPKCSLLMCVMAPLSSPCSIAPYSLKDPLVIPTIHPISLRGPP